MTPSLQRNIAQQCATPHPTPTPGPSDDDDNGDHDNGDDDDENLSGRRSGMAN